MANILAGNSDPARTPTGARLPAPQRPRRAASHHGAQDRHHQRRQGRLHLWAAAAARPTKDAPALALGVWMGNSDHASPRFTSLEVFSTDSAGSIWKSFMRDYMQGRCPVVRLQAPGKGLVQKTIDAFTGGKPGPWTRKHQDGVVHHGHGAGQQGRRRQGRPDVRASAAARGWWTSSTPSRGRIRSWKPARARATWRRGATRTPGRRHSRARHDRRATRRRRQLPSRSGRQARKPAGATPPADARPSEAATTERPHAGTVAARASSTTCRRPAAQTAPRPARQPGRRSPPTLARHRSSVGPSGRAVTDRSTLR